MKELILGAMMASLLTSYVEDTEAVKVRSGSTPSIQSDKSADDDSGSEEIKEKASKKNKKTKGKKAKKSPSIKKVTANKQKKAKTRAKVQKSDEDD